jgi:hypothetical protein
VIMSNPDPQKSSILDDEINLRALMLADRAVLRARTIPEESRDNIRAARQRQAERNRKLKSQPVVSPTKLRRTGYG